MAPSAPSGAAAACAGDAALAAVHELRAELRLELASLRAPLERCGDQMQAFQGEVVAQLKAQSEEVVGIRGKLDEQSVASAYLCDELREIKLLVSRERPESDHSKEQGRLADPDTGGLELLERFGCDRAEGPERARAEGPQDDGPSHAAEGGFALSAAASARLAEENIEGEYEADWEAPQAGAPPPEPPSEEEAGTALADFDGGEYGAEYMALRKGAPLAKLRDPPEEGGWAFGRSEGRSGWFPATMWAPLAPGDARPPQEQLASENVHLKTQLEWQQGHIAKLEHDLAELRRELDALKGHAAAVEEPPATEDRQAF